MQALRIPRYTEAEYLELDATHEGRHEYVNGEIVAMAGASFAHLRLGGAPELAPTTPETLLNPTVLIEVLSESTASYDRGEKLEHYRRRASVQAVVLVDSREVRVTVVSRNADATWTITDAVQGAVNVPGLDVVLDVAELYAGVGFGAGA